MLFLCCVNLIVRDVYIYSAELGTVRGIIHVSSVLFYLL